MKKACILISLFVLSVLGLQAAGPANKATGSGIRVRHGADPQTSPTWKFEFAAHEQVEMKNGKVRPAKGMFAVYVIDDSARYWAIELKCVNVLNDFEAVFAGEVVMTSGIGTVSPGDYFKVWVQDFGEPGAGVDTLFSRRTDPDEINVVEDAISFCTTPEEYFDGMAMWDVIDGNIQVHYRGE